MHSNIYYEAHSKERLQQSRIPNNYRRTIRDNRWGAFIGRWCVRGMRISPFVGQRRRRRQECYHHCNIIGIIYRFRRVWPAFPHTHRDGECLQRIAPPHGYTSLLDINTSLSRFLSTTSLLASLIDLFSSLSSIFRMCEPMVKARPK
jgi:hypothetical protein